MTMTMMMTNSRSNLLLNQSPEVSFFLDSMVWSYSRINTYNTCPRAFYQQYIECRNTIDNAFAQWGSLCHSIFERYFNNECDLWELSDIYKKEYDEKVTYRFPSTTMAKSYYERGIECFDSFEGLVDSSEKIVAVEEKYESAINGVPFTGIIDLVISRGNAIIICDHKSKSKWNNQDELLHYLKQLNLYAYHIKEFYGKWPSELWFHRFRAGYIDKIPFTLSRYDQDIKWFLSSVESIYKDNEFKASPDRFYCDYLCSVRQHCKFSSYNMA